MAGNLVDKLKAHKKAFFSQRDTKKHGGGAEWYLHLVVFPSLMDIAERLDALEASRSKGADEHKEDGR